MYMFRVYQRLSESKEDNFFDWRALIAISVILGIVSNSEKGQSFEYSQLII